MKAETGGVLAYLASAFALVDDFQRVLPACGVLHAFMHHRKVAVAQHASHLVALRYVGRHSRNLIHYNLDCKEEMATFERSRLA